MKPKGRHWVFLWLVAFLVVAGVVIARDTVSYRSARRLAQLRQDRLTLEAKQAELVRRVRQASSRAVLVPLVERRLGLRRPTDSEYVLFTLPDLEDAP
ncbi:MAG: hypothetical protein V3T16_00290 [Gemmatimonadales bacterium]